MKPKVAIIYLSYNARPYLVDVVDSVKKTNYPHEYLGLFIVDNFSTDHSVELIKETVIPQSKKDLPEVIFIDNQKNLGFAKGNNVAIQKALKQNYDYIFLLNTDAKLHPQAISHLVEMAEKDQKIGSIQPLIKLWQNEEVINSSGGMIHFLGFGFVRDNGRLVSEVSLKNGSEIAYASGAGVLYRATALKEVGLLDDYLFLYHEDLQLGWRLRLAGYKNVLNTKAIIYHDYQFKKSISKFFWMERNRLLVHLACLKIPTLILLFPLLFLLEIALFFLGLKGGWLKEKLLVWREFFKLKTWLYLKKKRKEIQKNRKVSDQEILRLFNARINHQETKSFIVDYIGNPILSFFWSVLKRIIFW